MKTKKAVNIFLAILIVGAIIIAIFALRTEEPTQTPMRDYDTELRELHDSIRVLKEDIAKYRTEIDRIDLERGRLKQELNLILKDNEKIDIELVNGDWDDNIKFLSDFLSAEGSIGE